MSTLRQLLSALWAAVWLRGRLLGLRVRRLFGGGSEPDTGPDFHQLGADVLADDADHDPMELPAELVAQLDLTRAELVEHARRAAPPSARSRARRRRRTASIAVATLLGLGAVGAGASALVAGSTGVPAVDRLLGIYESGLDKPDASERPGPSGSDLQPSPSKASEPIEVSLPDGSRSVVTSYVAKDGKICWAITSSDGGTPGALSCESAAGLNSRTQDGGYVPGMSLGADYVLLRGYVSSDVVSLDGYGPNGSLELQLGETWTPAAPGVEPLKPFVAVGPLSLQTATDAGQRQRALELRNYSFEALTDDGRRIPIAP